MRWVVIDKKTHTAAIFACKLGGIGVAPLGLLALVVRREEGGPGGYLEGVGKTEEADKESDIVLGGSKRWEDEATRVSK
jgi:hypothetical protein